MKVPKKLLGIVETRKPRVGFEGLLYYEICDEATTLVQQMRSEVQRLRDSQPKDGKLYKLGPEGLGLLYKIRKQHSIAIAFAAMCLEACIWDYAASGTSQNYTKDYLNKLDFVAKWVAVLCNFIKEF